MSKTADLTGKKFGRLKVLSFHEYRYGKGGHKDCYWLCKCDCGNQKIVSSGSLRSGNVKSCGCIKAERNKRVFTTHDMSGTRIYNIYTGMKQRCYNEKFWAYSDYGGRGITVCDEWLNNSKSFFDWAMANGYQDNLTLDRINNDGNYEPNNCHWVTMEKQCNNKRSNHNITCFGRTESMAEWSRILGIKIGKLKYWLYKNKDSEQEVIEKLAKELGLSGDFVTGKQ